MADEDLLATHLQELRRGTAVLACLSVLAEPRYGYALLETLKDGGLAVDGNTLYPLLRRLEKQGLLVSEWNTDDARPRKFYRTTSQGQSFRDRLLAEWHDLGTAIETFARSTS